MALLLHLGQLPSYLLKYGKRHGIIIMQIGAYWFSVKCSCLLFYAAAADGYWSVGRSVSVPSFRCNENIWWAYSDPYWLEPRGLWESFPWQSICCFIFKWGIQLKRTWCSSNSICPCPASHDWCSSPSFSIHPPLRIESPFFIFFLVLLYVLWRVARGFQKWVL